MLIGHISDSHLGAIPYNKAEREEDFYDAFNEAIDTLLKDHVDLIIHSGDVFDVPKPSGTALVKLVDALKKVKENGIDFVFTMGEHDISRVYSIPSPFLYQHVELAKYVGNGKPHRIANLTIVGFHKRRRDEIDELKEKLSVLDKQLENNENKKILVLHQGLYEFHKYAGELNVNDLPKNFDYYAMGHLHDRFENRFDGLKGPVCYPGSLDATVSEGIREFHKGFYIIDLSSNEASTQWVELKNNRKHFSFEISYSNMENEINMIVDKIKELRKKPMVNIAVIGNKIENAKVASSLRILENYSLYYQWSLVENPSQEIKDFLERPTDITQEMLNITEKITGSREAAVLAISEILPLLSEGRKDEALEILWKYFEERKKI